MSGVRPKTSSAQSFQPGASFDNTSGVPTQLALFGRVLVNLEPEALAHWTKATPELEWKLDKGPEQSIKISSLLDDIARERAEREASATSGDEVDPVDA